MADDKKRPKRQQCSAGHGAQDGKGIADAWEQYNAAENDLYAEIVQTPGAIPIPGEDGNPAEAIIYTGDTSLLDPRAAGIIGGAFQMLQTAKAIANSDATKTLQQAFFSLREYLKENGSDIKEIITAAKELTDLEPFINEELEARTAYPEFARLSIDDLLADKDEYGTPVKSIWSDIIEKAKARQDAARNPRLPTVKYSNGYTVKAITDKFANVFFALSAPVGGRGYVNGQRQFISLKYDGRKSKKEILLYYDYEFNESIIKAFGLEKKFNDYDFFVMTTLDNLYGEGNTVVSLTKIWREMGNEGTPATKQLTELSNSLRKGMSTILTVNDLEVQKAWDNNTDKWHELISPAMPIQLINERFVANGQTASGMVKINGLSPFFIVAQSIGHYGTWSKDILRLYKGRRTKRYYSVMHYLIWQIGWMTHPHSKRNNKITFSDLYGYTGEKQTRAQQLTKNMMYRLLDEVFIPTGYINAYREDDTGEPGTLIYYGNKKAIADKK